MTIKRGGHTFQGVDKPIRTPGHSSGKSHAVVIKQGDGFRLIRFGMQGAKTKEEKQRRASYYARHNAQNPNPTIFSPLFWSHKVKW